MRKTMELNKGHIAFSVACFICGAIIGAGLRSCSVKPNNIPPAAPVVLHDTVRITETVRIESKTKPVAPPRDTIWLVKPDTDNHSVDTTKMMVRETKEYRDTFATDSSRIELGVRFSGYEAKIEDIDLQYRFSVQPRTIVKKKGWGQFVGVGIGLGYGASVVGQRVYAAPEVGVHITYGWGYHW